MLQDTSHRKGYIFLCSNSTEDECLQRMLLGGTKGYSSIVKVKIGDILFLYNYIAQRMHGVFEAISDSELNIEPNSWGGKFPWQVKVRWAEKYGPLTLDKFIHITPLGKRNFPPTILNEEQTEKLVSAFKKSENIPEGENDYRKKFEAKYWADDGHKVRSLGELTIDNWLFHQGICHGYERKAPIAEELYCDFWLPLEEQKGYVYIEYWGLEDDAYRRRREQKLFLYHKYNYFLVELTREDLEKLDDIMPKKLRPFFKNRSFH